MRHGRAKSKMGKHFAGERIKLHCGDLLAQAQDRILKSSRRFLSQRGTAGSSEQCDGDGAAKDGK